MEERKKVLRVYNRKPVEGQYPNGLAYSVHMSVKEDEEECPLHNNLSRHIFCTERKHTFAGSTGTG